MGFSVSTTFALVFFGTLIAMSGFYAATANTAERLQAATEDRRTHLRTVQETAITVTDVEIVRTTDCTVQINATNDGSTELGLNDTDVLVDGKYHDGWQADATVDGDGETFIWLPGDRLSLNVTADGTPSRAKVVTGSGVAASGRYTGVASC